jgi:hypothetical protein
VARSKLSPQTASHQTARLSRGSHTKPEEGVCVMELASMLAGERFTDHPRSVCPVIAAFLRTYNDRVDDDRRQDLYAYAAEVVGTRADRTSRRARLDLCQRFADRVAREAAPRPPSLPCFGRAEWTGRRAALAAAEASHRRGHSMALALLDALIAVAPVKPAERSRPAPASARAPRQRSDSTSSRRSARA